MEDRSQAAVGSPTRSQPILPQECPPKVLGKPEWLPLDEKEQLVYEHLLHELGPTDVARVTHIKLTCFLRGFQAAVPRVGLTAQAVRRHIAWQDEIGLHDLLFAPPSDLVDRHQEWRRGWHYEIVGADVMGHPIACHRLGQVDLDDLLTRFTVDQMQQHVVRDMELVDQIKRNISAEVGYRVYKTTLVIDLEGMTWGKHLSAVFKDNLKMATSLLIENYPETIWRVYIINAPAIFRFAWTFIRPMLTGDMIAKVTVIGASAEKIKQVLHLGGVALDKVSIASEGPAALWALGEEAVRRRAYRLQDTAAAAAATAALQPVPASQPKGRRSPGRAGFAANHSGSAREIADRRKRSPKLREKRPPSGAGAARGSVPMTPEPQRGSAVPGGEPDGAWNSPPSSVETVFATPPTALLDESLPVFTPHTPLTGRHQSATGRRRGGWLSCGAPALCGGVGAGKGAAKYSRAATTASEAAEADRDGAAAVSAAAFAAVLPAKKTPAARAGAASKGVKGSGSAHTQPGLDETVDVVQQRKRRSRGRQYPNRAQLPAVPPRDAIMHYGGGSSSSSSDNGDNSPVGTASNVEGELGSSSEWRDGDGESPEAAGREQAACPSPSSMMSRLMANRWRAELDLNEEKNEQRTREMVARGQKRSVGYSGCCHRVGVVCWEGVIQRTIACLSCGRCCAGATGGRAERHVGRVYSSAET
jgi:hypothetical protein